MRVDNGMIVHRIDTFGGNSGSAIYYKKDKELMIVGIHTGGRPNSPYMPGYNFGPRITVEHLDFINQFKATHRPTTK